MGYLFKKMRKDLTAMWTQFFSVFLMAFLGIVIFSGMEGAWAGLNYELNSMKSKTNMADAWCYGNNITDEQKDEILNLSKVTRIEEVMTNEVKSKVSNKFTEIKMICNDDNKISKLCLKNGKKFNKDDEGIWLDKSYADKNNIKVNDYISVSISQKDENLKVLGLILHPEYVYYTGSTTLFLPNHNTHGYGVVNKKTAEKLYGRFITTEVRMKIKSGTDTSKLQKDIESILKNNYISFKDRSTLTGISMPTDKVNQIKSISIMFCAIFILLAMLTMQTSMTRLVSNQRIQIGTLKALGFSNSTINIHYALYGFCISLLGSVAAVITGPLVISPILLKVLKAQMVLPKYNIRLSYYSFIAILIVIISCTLTTVLSVSKSLRRMPAETMRGAAPRKEKVKDVKEYTEDQRSKSFVLKWAVRDIFRYKMRSIMGIIGVIGCMVLIMAGLGMKYTISRANNEVYKHQYTYKQKVVLENNITEDEKNELSDMFNSDSTWIMESSLEGKNDGKNESGTISIYENQNFIKLHDEDDKKVKLPKEGACITRKYAKELNVKKGDTISIRIPGEKDYKKVKIEKIVMVPSPQGIIMSKDAYTKTGADFRATALLASEKNDKDKIKNLSYVKEYTTIDEQYDSAEEILESLKTVFSMMIGLASVLAVVILYNLGILSYTERVREYATMKVLGFYQREITMISVCENILTTLTGWIISIPAGIAFLHAYVSIIAIDSQDWIARISLARIGIASLVTVGCAVAVTLLLSLKVRKINMVEALKSVE